MKSNIIINSPKLWLRYFPWKKKGDHKYSRGKVIIFGSQLNMVGSTILSAEAALRVGTGSVKIICTKKNLVVYSLKFPSVLKEEINSLKSLKKLINKEKNSVFLIGPGAGVNSITKKRTELILKNSKYAIIDADALTCFKKKPAELYSLLDKNKIITAHIKVFHSIFPKIIKKFNNYEKIVKASKICKCNIVLKGANTLISTPNENIGINKHASSELAVIGSGDVLSGIIASLVGKKKLSPFLACCAAVWIHGDVAKKFGPGLIAEDVVKNIPKSLKKLKKTSYKKNDR